MSVSVYLWKRFYDETVSVLDIMEEDTCNRFIWRLTLSYDPINYISNV